MKSPAENSDRSSWRKDSTTQGASSWTYANDAAILVAFLAGTLAILSILAAIVVSRPTDPEVAAAADVLLGMAVFLLLFGILVFVPRLLVRGAMSYSLHVDRPMDDVEQTVRRAVESVGRSARVEIPKRRIRSRRPPRTLQIDGTQTLIVLRAAPYRENRADGTSWTEVVLARLTSRSDQLGIELRDRISSGLAGA